LGVILTQSGEGNLVHPIYFTSKNLSNAEKNYPTIEWEDLTMVYCLLKFQHSLLGSLFKFFANHSALKYLVNKPMLEGINFHWFMLFQEFTFEVIVKPRKSNVGSDHLCRLE